MFAGARCGRNVVQFRAIAVFLLSMILGGPPHGYAGRPFDAVVVGLHDHLSGVSNPAGAFTDAHRPTTATKNRGAMHLADSVKDQTDRIEPHKPRVTDPIFPEMMFGTDDQVRKLINNSFDVNAKYRYGRTLLMQAAVFCRSKIAAFLLDKNAEIDARDNTGMTALMLAVRCTPEIVEILVRRGADVNARAKDGSTALIWAVCYLPAPLISPLPEGKGSRQPSQALRQLVAANDTIKKTDLPTVHRGTHTEWLYRSHRNQMKRDAQRAARILQILLDAGADLNAKSKYGNTALMQASHRESLVRFLLEKGADANAKDRDGRTALMIASQGGCVESVKALIENEADVNAKDDGGKTTLMKTAESPFLPTYSSSLDNKKQQHRARIAELLIAKGADIKARSKEGETALKIAQENGWHAMVKVLKAHGAKE